MILSQTLKCQVALNHTLSYQEVIVTFKLTESSSWLTTDIIYAGGACSGFGVKDFGGGQGCHMQKYL